MNSRLQKFLSYYAPYRGLLLADLACALVVAAATLLMPLLARYITKDILGSNGPDMITQITAVGALMVALAAVNFFCEMFVDYRGHQMGALMERDMRQELFDHYQKLSFAFYDEQKTGQLMTRLTNDSFAMSELYHHGPEDIVISLLKFVGAFLILINVNVQLTLVIFLFLPVMAIYAFYFNQRMNVAMRQSKDRIGDVNAQVEESLAGIRVVKSFTNEGMERAKFADANNRFLASRSESYLSEAWFFAGMNAFMQLITVAVVVLGGVAIVNASLDLADLLTYLLCVAILIDPIRRAVNFARLYQEGITGFARFMEMLEVQPEIQDAPNATDIGRAHGNIKFEQVSFRYKDDHAHVLKNISLAIRPGEYVALVGSSGVGKSTLCALIPRFYEASAGRVLVDGVDVRAIQLHSLRGNIGVVQQDVYLFGGTVAENIRYGKRDASEAEIVAAAQRANAHDFIMRLPQGYATEVGERGVKLSGGQKQRLSIARVFLKDPPILIFDEATSALDNESERAVQASLEQLRTNRTTLVIAHRLSTIRNAQRILVLTDNGISEQGTHDELITRNGAYAALYNVQLAI